MPDRTTATTSQPSEPPSIASNRFVTTPRAYPATSTRSLDIRPPLPDQEEHRPRRDEPRPQGREDDGPELDPGPDQQGGDERPGDGPEHVPRAFQAIGPPVVGRFDGVGQQVVAQRTPVPATDP